MKYEALKSYFAAQRQARIRLSFEDVARVAKTRLPSSAYEHAAWWANDSRSHTQAKAWLEAGYKTENIDLSAKRVEFVRKEEARSGVREMRQDEFQHQQFGSSAKKHPMAGALKGTFTIARGWDITRSTLDDEEVAEMEANLERTADMIDDGLRRQK